MFNLGIDLDRFVFGWHNNWNNSNDYIEIKLFKYFRLYPYLKNIYLKLKKYHFTFRPSVNPYFNYINNQEANYLINEIINQYSIFINNYKITNYEFIVIAPAWYIDNNQINKYQSYYSKDQFKNLKKNLPHYIERMKNNINYFKQALKSKGFNNTIIDNIVFFDQDLFHENNYHLNIKGHEKISNIL